MFGLATLSRDGGPAHVALVRGDRALPLAAIAPDLADLPDLDATVLGMVECWDEAFGVILSALDRAGARAWEGAAPLDAFTIHPPFVPRQIFCTGANYRKHVIDLILGDVTMRGGQEQGITDPAELRRRAEAIMDQRAAAATPYCFVKLPSCVIGARDTVVLPRNVEKPDWELELGVVIGRRARHVTPERAMDHVAGFAIVNDVTARDHVFRRDGSALGADWLSGKCFPTFLPFGPMIVPRQFVADPYDLTITLSVGGTTYQNESTADMMIGIAEQIAYLSGRVELLPGDLVCTGSPAGNGAAHGVFLKDGDIMDGAITGLGRQHNRCRAEA